MSDYDTLQLTQAALFVTAGMLFFMTLLYIAATPDADEPRPKGWWKPKAPDSYCPLHRIPRSQCDPKHKEKD